MTGGGQTDADGQDEPSRERIAEAVRAAAAEHGENVTVREFRAGDYAVSEGEIKREFGTWNEAKAAAGLETQQRGTATDIDETFFRRVDDGETAYWLGTLFARSSLHQHPDSDTPSLRLGRVEEKGHFVTGLLEAVDAEYAVNHYTARKGGNDQIQVAITNPTFVEHLLAAGYPRHDDDSGFPDIGAAFAPAFVRGYLESKGNFTTGGWNVSVANETRARELKGWFEEFGAKRPTVSDTESEGWVVRVSNAFDIESVYATCWPESVDTEPSFDPYARRIVDSLREQHPYPENVDYL